MSIHDIDKEGVFACGNCGGDFLYEEVTVTFNTFPFAEAICKSCENLPLLK